MLWVRYESVQSVIYQASPSAFLQATYLFEDVDCRRGAVCPNS